MREIEKIIIHCSDSGFGNAEVIDKWHRQRGWDEIGYHFVILNGRLESSSKYNKNIDGHIEKGRDVEKKGAHCYGHNRDSIGICLIGKEAFTGDQLLTALPFIVNELKVKYGLTNKDVYPHNEFNSGKTCPNLSKDYIRRLLKLDNSV